jgi:subfamily B ATP-binding cassette protein MsbA
MDANAWEFVNKFPQGLDTDVGANAKSLSGGEKQRVRFSLLGK